MTISQILDGLERSNAAGPEAEVAARISFLEWAITSRHAASPLDAQQALDALGTRHASSAAARVFVGYLQQATRPAIPAPRRSRRACH